MTESPSPADAAPAERGASDVAVNLLWCVPGQVGGSEQYLVRQLLGLASSHAQFAPHLYCLTSFAAAHEALRRLYPMTSPSISGERRAERILTEHRWLARRTRDARLVHHGGGTAPLGGRRPFVLTIHDLQYLTYPGYFTPTKRRYLDAAVPRSIARAAVVTVPSDYVRTRVVDAFGADPDRVVVVPHGVEASLGAHAPPAEELRRFYGLGDGRVLVFPAITHPHKGHRFLLRTMAQHWPDPDLRLVLLGGPGAVEAEVVADIERLGLTGRVVRAGRVPDAHRDGLIALADAMVFPSEYEGFGAPVVEAMALGTPVICADLTALPEVVGDAGLVLPLDDAAWADALDVVAARGDTMRAAGRQRAERYTAECSGRALARAYEMALA
jgi:glycosyltransferase involved in cell wall biosynthesis